MTAVVVHSDLEILGGTPVFVGTRVPQKTFSIISSVATTLMSSRCFSVSVEGTGRCGQ
jgi:hypothetical protein